MSWLVVTRPLDADLGHLGVVAVELRRAGDVLGRAVAVVGDGHDLLRPFALHQPLARKHFDARHRGVGLLAIRHALLDPPMHQPISGGVDLDPLTAAVRQPGRGLEQQQALLGGRGKEPAAAPFLHEILVVFCRLKAQQRQTKAVLPARLAVAAAAVAAVLGEERRDLIRKIDRQILNEVGHLHLHSRIDARRGRDMDRRLAFGDRRDQPSRIDGNNASRRNFVGRLARQIARLAGRELPRDDELLTGVAAGNRHGAVR